MPNGYNRIMNREGCVRKLYGLILMHYPDTGTEETHKVTESLHDSSHMQIHALQGLRLALPTRATEHRQFLPYTS
jgi:hypothetical protein